MSSRIQLEETCSQEVGDRGYNENSGKLIVKEYAKDNSYVGIFEGTYIDGCYKGTFTNIKGVSIPFNLR